MINSNDSLIEKIESGKSAVKNSMAVARNGAIDFCIDIIRQHTAAPDVVERLQTMIDWAEILYLSQPLTTLRWDIDKAIAAMGGVPLGLPDGEQTGPVTPPTTDNKVEQSLEKRLKISIGGLRCIAYGDAMTWPSQSAREVAKRALLDCGGEKSCGYSEDSMGSPTRYTDGSISREYDEQPVRSGTPVIAQMHQVISGIISPGQINDSDPLAAKVMEYIKPYLRTTVPVSVSLEKCAEAVCLAAGWHKQDAATQPIVNQIVKAVLNAAGVAYVD